LTHYRSWSGRSFAWRIQSPAVDLLSDAFRAIRLVGALYFDVSATAPWIAETPAAATLRARTMREFEHVISIHIVLAGAAWAQLADQSQPAIGIAAGDTVIFGHGDAHFMSSEPDARPLSKSTPGSPRVDEALPFALSEARSGDVRARFVSAYFGCNARPYNPMLSALPRLLHVRGSSCSNAVTTELISAALAESRQPRAGGKTILSRIGELMFLRAIRQYVESSPGRSTGWLAALRDHNVSAALNAVHVNPAEPWTLSALAREAGLSRSMFAKRFRRVTGMSAMQYLGNWRLQLATSMLEQEGASVTRIASYVGYESDAAFNRAFKKRLGVPPGTWRRLKLGA
jgi:AraC-like DNA-binding protein